MGIVINLFKDHKSLIWVTVTGLVFSLPVQANDLGANTDLYFQQINQFDQTSLVRSKTNSIADTDFYNDLAAFEAAHGAPYSDELAHESPPENIIEYQPDIGIDRYLVLASFTDHAYAQNFIDRAGLKDVFIQPFDINGKRYQRVLIGPMSQEEAVSSKAVAKDHGIADSWILRSQ